MLAFMPMSRAVENSVAIGGGNLVFQRVAPPVPGVLLVGRAPGLMPVASVPRPSY